MDPHSSGQPGQPIFQWLSFAHQGLTEIPNEAILTQTDTLEVLDLSYNLLDDPYWNPALLGQLEKLSTLILDCNNYTSHIKFPYMPSVTTVCINKNKINNLPVQYVISQIPGLEILDDTEVLEKERAQARKTYRLQQSSHSSRKRPGDSSKKNHARAEKVKYCHKPIG
ncbi:hypothetical protein FQN60_006244 [Etheostoma spectabile]|uniref:U2A'/phosphoprotein 32 family A C-terminal domain-containing protein n=1 Tax=Etheostoma spectabile TaxID=54343 RepID=A0A5J5CP26_9PERO|nr:hypothetical protein FQN60_006244 [Etheostoma spectabile]